MVLILVEFGIIIGNIQFKIIIIIEKRFKNVVIVEKKFPKAQNVVYLVNQLEEMIKRNLQGKS